MNNRDLKTRVYDHLLDLLHAKAQAANITTEALSLYFSPLPIEPPQNRAQYYLLASSLQNGTSSGMDRSIKFNAENRQIITEVLRNFDFAWVAEHHDDKTLYAAFNEKIADGGAISRAKRANGKPQEIQEQILNRKTNWEKYAKGLYEGAQFLCSETGQATLNGLLSHGAGEPLDIKWLQKQLGSIKIHGLGTALKCDWLKECGCTWLVKPDVHIKKVYAQMAAQEQNKPVEEIQENDLDVIAYYDEWAKVLNERGRATTAYQIDKIIWLICTGDFYLHKDPTIGRDTILNYIREQE